MLYVFDMGNVTIRGIEVLDQTIELLGVDADEFNADYEHYVYPLMEGLLTCDDYYRHVEHVFGVKVPGKPFSDFFKPYFNKPMVEVFQMLKARGERIICASNTFEPHWTIIQNLGLDRYFDKCYLSHEMGLSKPSKAYFQALMKEEGVEPKDIVFTDDTLDNIEAATRMGMNAILYHKDMDGDLLSLYQGL